MTLAARLLTMIVLATSVSITPRNILAHETKYTGDFGILLHTEPDDNPFVGEQAQMFFAFTTGETQFHFDTCICSLRIELKDKQVSGGELKPADESYGTNVGYYDFVFPQKGVYEITLVGSPKNPLDFHEFEVSYDLRVDRDNPHTFASLASGDSKAPTNLIIYAVALLTTIVILVVGLRKPSKKQKSK